MCWSPDVLLGGSPAPRLSTPSPRGSRAQRGLLSLQLEIPAWMVGREGLAGSQRHPPRLEGPRRASAHWPPLCVFLEHQAAAAFLLPHPLANILEPSRQTRPRACEPGLLPQGPALAFPMCDFFGFPVPPLVPNLPSTPRSGRWVLSGERVNPWASPQRHRTWPTSSSSHALQTPLLLAQKVCGVPARTLLPRHPAETKTQTPQNQTNQPSCQEALRVEVTCCPVSLPLPPGPGCWAAGRSPPALMAPTCSCAQLTPI